MYNLSSRVIGIFHSNRESIHSLNFRIHHLSSLSEVPLYYFPNAEEDRILFSDDYENEIGVTLLLGRDSDDVCKRGILRMFDDASGELIRTMHFDSTLDIVCTDRS